MLIKRDNSMNSSFLSGTLLQYLNKQSTTLREVNDSRVKIYEQLEVSIAELETTNKKLIEENMTDKVKIRRYVFLIASETPIWMRIVNLFFLVYVKTLKNWKTVVKNFKGFSMNPVVCLKNNNSFKNVDVNGVGNLLLRNDKRQRPNPKMMKKRRKHQEKITTLLHPILKVNALLLRQALAMTHVNPDIVPDPCS